MTYCYRGRRLQHRTLVWKVDDWGEKHPLALRLNLSNHSPTGFEWGYAGSGPAQLALAILADALGDDERAVRLHQRFKAAFVQNFDRESWMVKAADVRAWETTIGALP